MCSAATGAAKAEKKRRGVAGRVRSFRRRAAEGKLRRVGAAQAAAGATLDTFLGLGGCTEPGVSAESDVEVGLSSGEEDSLTEPLHYDRDGGEVSRLLGEGQAAAKARGDASMHLAYSAVLLYHSMIRSGRPRIEASVAVSSTLYHNPAKGAAGVAAPYKYRAEKIRRWLKHSLQHKHTPESASGKHRSVEPRIYDEDFQQRCRNIIKRLPGQWSARGFRHKLIKVPQPAHAPH